MNLYPFAHTPGRRPKRSTPMPRSSFTAEIETMVFLRLFSGDDSTYSRGIQRAAKRLAQIDQEGAEFMKEALWICEAASAEIGKDDKPPSQIELFEHISGHLERLRGLYEESLALTETATASV